jgi:hypothetical protein
MNTEDLADYGEDIVLPQDRIMNNQNKTTDAEIVDSGGSGLAIVKPPENYAVGRALTVQEIVAQVRLIQDVMREVMTEGEHFGVIPGCGTKKTLLQPGAQKLAMTFRLAPEYAIQETNLSGGHKEYRVVCTLKSVQNGGFVGQGVGVCSTMESKYRFKGGARKCPECGKETIIKGKKEYGAGWLCFAKKGGCGAKWPDGAAAIEGQSVDRIEHDNPADFFNTVLKIGKKRAFVDATITATSASDIFNQDYGDPESDAKDAPEPAGAPQAERKTPTPQPSTPVTPPPARPAPATNQAVVAGVRVTNAAAVREWLEFARTKLLKLADGPMKHVWWEYGRRRGWMAAVEPLEKASAAKMFPGITSDYTIIAQTAKLKDIFEQHAMTVRSMADDSEGGLQEEWMAAMLEAYTLAGAGLAPAAAAPQPAAAAPQPAAAAPQPAAAAPQPAAAPGFREPGADPFLNKCPNCTSSATKASEEFDDIAVCESCGWQWELLSRQPYESHDFMRVVCPVPPKGMKKADYERNPSTLGQIMRTDNRRAFGLVMNFKADGWTNREGKYYGPTDADKRFAAACEEAKLYFESKKGEVRP